MLHVYNLSPNNQSVPGFENLSDGLIIAFKPGGLRKCYLSETVFDPANEHMDQTRVFCFLLFLGFTVDLFEQALIELVDAGNYVHCCVLSLCHPDNLPVRDSS